MEDGSDEKKLHSKLWTFLYLIFEGNKEGPKCGITRKAIQQEFETRVTKPVFWTKSFSR